MWKKLTLTTAADNDIVAFSGRGSIYAEGTFGGGALGAYIVYRADDNGAPTVASGYMDYTLSAAGTLDLPAGEYQLKLTGSTGASVDVYYNDQFEGVRTR